MSFFSQILHPTSLIWMRKDALWKVFDNLNEKARWPESDRERIGLAAAMFIQWETFSSPLLFSSSSSSSFSSCSCPCCNSLTHYGIQIFRGGSISWHGPSQASTQKRQPAFPLGVIQWHAQIEARQLIWFCNSHSSDEPICVCIYISFCICVCVCICICICILLLMDAVRDGRWAVMARSILALRHFANRGRSSSFVLASKSYKIKIILDNSRQSQC